MSKSNFHISIWKVILLVAIQLLIDNYIDIGVYVSFFICGYIILSLPLRLKTITTMLIAFALGLLLDLLGNGIMGLYAGSLTAMALFKDYFISITTSEQSIESIVFPSAKSFGLIRYAVYVLLCYLVFYIFYILFDTGFHIPLLFGVIKLFVSSIVNTLLIIIISVLTIK